MTDVFDNTTSITIGGKEVKSIEIDGGTIWEEEVDNRTLKLVFEEGFTDLLLSEYGGELSDYRMYFVNKQYKLFDGNPYLELVEGDTGVLVSEYEYLDSSQRLSVSVSVRNISDITTNVVQGDIRYTDVNDTIYCCVNRMYSSPSLWIKGTPCDG